MLNFIKVVAIFVSRVLEMAYGNFLATYHSLRTQKFACKIIINLLQAQPGLCVNSSIYFGWKKHDKYDLLLQSLQQTQSIFNSKHNHF